MSYETLIVPQRRGRKEDCPGCQKLKEQDWADRWPVGACGPECLILVRRAEKVS